MTEPSNALLCAAVRRKFGNAAGHVAIASWSRDGYAPRWSAAISELNADPNGRSWTKVAEGDTREELLLAINSSEPIETSGLHVHDPDTLPPDSTA